MKLALVFLLCLLVTGCARPNGSADQNRQGGFYAGIEGGPAR